MKQVEQRYGNYFLKSSKWLFGNFLFGLVPLWFILFVYLVSGGRAGKEEVDHIIVRDGAILFVCCAIMGSVLVDFMLAGLTIKIGVAYRLAIIPVFIMLLLLTDYSLIMGKIIDDDCFTLSSCTSKLVIALSALFSLITKTSLYIKEDAAHG